MESRARLAVTRVAIHHEVAMSVSQRQAGGRAGTKLSTQACRRASCPLGPVKNTFAACRGDGRAEPQEDGQGQERVSVVAPATWVLGGPTGSGLPLHTAGTHCLPALIIAPFFLRFLRAHEAPLGCRLCVVLRSRKHIARGARRVSRLARGALRPML